MIKLHNSINLQNILEIPEDNKLYISGYAMHFNEINHNGEMVRPGAFDEFFAELKEHNILPIFNAFHKQDYLIGAWEEIKQDETGLYVEGFLDLNIAEVRDNIAPLVKNGALSGLSTEMWINYNDIEDKGDHYVVNKAMLTGISLVPIPADFSARIVVKNNLENQNPSTEPVENQLDPDNQEKSEKSVSKSLLFYI